MTYPNHSTWCCVANESRKRSHHSSSRHYDIESRSGVLYRTQITIHCGDRPTTRAHWIGRCPTVLRARVCASSVDLTATCQKNNDSLSPDSLRNWLAMSSRINLTQVPHGQSKVVSRRNVKSFTPAPGLTCCRAINLSIVFVLRHSSGRVPSEETPPPSSYGLPAAQNGVRSSSSRRVVQASSLRNLQLRRAYRA